MKKYSSGSFVDAAVRVYGSEADTISSFPALIITNGGNITPWTIYGNTSGDHSVGEKTENLVGVFVPQVYINNANGVAMSQVNSVSSDYIEVESETNYYITPITSGNWGAWYDENKDFISGITGYGAVSSPVDAKYVRLTVSYNSSNPDYADNFMIIKGSTAPSAFIPYGYKLPVVIGSTTTNIYMSDVLRKSSGADPVYDVMSSTGVITRNVDTDGSPLPTPTTESFTAPTLATVAGSQSFTIDTTVKPSSVSLTYTGWHIHSDKQYSGGSWGQVTSNAKVLRRKKSSKSKT